MDGPSEVEERSLAILHGKQRLRFAAAIAALPAEFKTRAAIEATDMKPADVSKEISHFRQAGLLRKMGHGQYERMHDAFWQGCRKLYDELVAELRPATPTRLQSVRRRAR